MANNDTKNTMKNKISNIVLCTVFVLFVLTAFIFVHNTKEKANNTAKNTEDNTETEVDQCDIDSWVPTVRNYDGVKVNKYNEQYLGFSEERCMSDYIYKTLDELYPTKEPATSHVLDSRGAYLYELNCDGYKVWYELENDINDANTWYIKIYSTNDSEPVYYIITLTHEKDEDYLVDIKKTSYQEIKSSLTKFTDKPSEYTDDETYCKALVEYYNSQNVYHWEGYGDQELDVDMMMEIMGYK